MWWCCWRYWGCRCCSGCSVWVGFLFWWCWDLRSPQDILKSGWVKASFQAILDIRVGWETISSVTTLLLGCLSDMNRLEFSILTKRSCRLRLMWMMWMATDMGTTVMMMKVSVPNKRTFKVCGERQVKSPVRRFLSWNTSEGCLFVIHFTSSSLIVGPSHFNVQLQSRGLFDKSISSKLRNLDWLKFEFLSKLIVVRLLLTSKSDFSFGRVENVSKDISSSFGLLLKLISSKPIKFQ